MHLGKINSWFTHGKKWFTHEIREAVDKKDEAYRKASSEAKLQFKIKRNAVVLN